MPAIDWKTIDTVLLDMDGTLLDLHFDNHFWLEHLPQCYASHRGCDLEQARAFLMALSERLHGSLDWYCLDYWSEALELDIPALKQEVCHLIRMRPDTEQFLAHLQALGKQAVLVTNAHPVALALKLESSGLDRHIGDHISSHRFRLAKENPGFWAALREERGFDYTRCLFVDDNLHVLRRAAEEGPSHLLQILHPDTTQAPHPASEFPGICNFREVLPV